MRRIPCTAAFPGGHDQADTRRVDKHERIDTHRAIATATVTERNGDAPKSSTTPTSFSRMHWRQKHPSHTGPIDDIVYFFRGVY